MSRLSQPSYGEAYPVLYIGLSDGSEHDESGAVDVPDELWERLESARTDEDAAERAILRYLHARGELNGDVAERFDYLLSDEATDG